MVISKFWFLSTKLLDISGVFLNLSYLSDHPTNHSNSVSETDDKSSNNIQKQNDETATTTTQVINDGNATIDVSK